MNFVEVIAAVYGAPSGSADVEEKVQELFNKGVEQITVNPQELGVDPAPEHLKNFGVIYRVGENVRAAAGGEGDTVTLLRPAAPRVFIAGAVYGSVNGSENVTDKVQEMVNSGQHTIEASNGNFGDPSPETPKHLTVSWQLEEEGEIYTAACAEGESVQVG